MKRTLLIIALFACFSITGCLVQHDAAAECREPFELDGNTYIVKINCLPTQFQRRVDSLWDEQYIENLRAERLSTACSTLKSEGLNACECEEALILLADKAARTRKSIDKMVCGIPYRFRTDD